MASCVGNLWRVQLWFITMTVLFFRRTVWTRAGLHIALRDNHYEHNCYVIFRLFLCNLSRVHWRVFLWQWFISWNDARAKIGSRMDLHDNNCFNTLLLQFSFSVTYYLLADILPLLQRLSSPSAALITITAEISQLYNLHLIGRQFTA